MDTFEVGQLKKDAEVGDAFALYKLGAMYLASDNSEQKEEGKKYLINSAQRDYVDAQILLGDFYIKHLCAGEENYRTGAEWYNKAALLGSSSAQMRLGVLYLTGLGVSQDDVAALKWISEAASKGDDNDVCSLAYLYANGIGISRNGREAVKLYIGAALNGSARAFYSLGLRYSYGENVRQNHAIACALFFKAMEKGYPGSQSSYDNLHIILSDDQVKEKNVFIENLDESLKKELASLETLKDSSANDEYAVDDNEDIDISPETEILSWQPRIIKIHNFLTQEESDHLIDIAIRLKSDSESDEDKRTASSLGVSFSGHTTLLNISMYDPILCLIDRRIAKYTHMPVSNGESISMLGYTDGQSYSLHVDYFLTDDASAAHIHKHVGQRLITFLMYLNDVDEGGETRYSEANIDVSPEKGAAIMHYNCLPDGSVDPLTVHTSLPVTKGVKWLARKAICEKPLF